MKRFIVTINLSELVTFVKDNRALVAQYLANDTFFTTKHLGANFKVEGKELELAQLMIRFPGFAKILVSEVKKRVKAVLNRLNSVPTGNYIEKLIKGKVKRIPKYKKVNNLSAKGRELRNQLERLSGLYSSFDEAEVGRIQTVISPEMFLANIK